jgi:multisubunit Na+/H+ antiporter MnhC subunit
MVALIFLVVAIGVLVLYKKMYIPKIIPVTIFFIGFTFFGTYSSVGAETMLTCNPVAAPGGILPS